MEPRTPDAKFKTRKVRPSEKVERDFKGHLVDNRAVGRQEDTRARLEGMEKRIADWKQVSKLWIDYSVSG